MIINTPGAVYHYDGIEYVIGEPIAGTSESEYEGLFGSITEIRDGRDKETDNETPDLYCSFDVPLLAEDMRKLEKRFSELYGEPKTTDDIILDEVILAPRMVEPVGKDTGEYKLTIYEVSEDWSVNGETGHNVTIYGDYNSAKYDFTEKLKEEMDSGCISKFENDEENFVLDTSEDYYEVYIDGEHMMNHYILSITEHKIPLTRAFKSILIKTLLKQKIAEDFKEQIEPWDRLDELNEKQLEKLHKDPRLFEMVKTQLLADEVFWETYSEIVCDVAYKLVDEYVKNAEEQK